MKAFASTRARKRIGIALSATTAPLLVAVACSNTLQGTLSIVTGPDNGFAQNPVPTSIQLSLINSLGEASVVAEASLPSANGFSLPPQPGSAVDIIQVTGFDEAGTAVVSGATVPVALDQISGITLNIFVQRTGQFSRLPAADAGTLAAEFQWSDGGNLSTTPLMTTLQARYLLVADGLGKSPQTQLYDTLTWQLDPAPPNLPINPLSLVYVDQYTGSDASVEAGGPTPVSALLMLGAKGTAAWLDLTDSTGTGADAEVLLDATAIATNYATMVAGGQTLVTPGNTYVVGATRLTSPKTNEVLRISPLGGISWTTLTQPRLGAAAAYVSGSNVTAGIFVFGGESAGDAGSLTGVEFIPDSLTPSATAYFTLPFDTTKGAGAVAFDLTTSNPKIMLAGGVLANGKGAPTRVFTVGSLIAQVPLTPNVDAGFDAAPATEAGAHDAATDALADAGKRDATLGTDAGTPGTSADAGDAGDAGVDAGNTYEIWPALPVVLTSTQVYALTDSTGPQGASFIIVGTQASGTTVAYTLTQTAVTPVPFRVNRTHGQSTLLPNGSLAVVGGDSGTIESFIP